MSPGLRSCYKCVWLWGMSSSRLGKPCPCGLLSAAHGPPPGLAMHTACVAPQLITHVPGISNILGFPLWLRIHPASLNLSKSPPVTDCKGHSTSTQPHQHLHSLIPSLCIGQIFTAVTQQRERVSGRKGFGLWSLGPIFLGVW